MKLHKKIVNHLQDPKKSLTESQNFNPHADILSFTLLTTLNNLHNLKKVYKNKLNLSYKN